MDLIKVLTYIPSTEVDAVVVSITLMSLSVKVYMSGSGTVKTQLLVLFMRLEQANPNAPFDSLMYVTVTVVMTGEYTSSADPY